MQILYTKDNTQINRPTNLTNGYDIEISFVSSTHISVEDLAAQSLDGSRIERSWGASISPLTDILISNKNSKMFSIQNCTKGGESSQYYIDDGGAIIQISTNIIGSPSDKDKYKTIINTFISPINFK